MIIKTLLYIQKKIVSPRWSGILKNLKLYNFIKRAYRNFIFFIGKNGLAIKVEGVSAKIIVSNPNELNFYHSLDNEKLLIKKLLARLTKETVFYDIGAHIGLYSLCVSTYKIKPKFVYCWEPEPFNFKRLNDNISKNNLRKIKAFNLALGSENRQGKLIGCAKEPGSLVPSFAKEDNQGVLVEIARGDDFVFSEHLFLPSIIKIDVEGYELNVLKGFKKILKKEKPTIFLEVHPILLKNLGFTKETMLNFLVELGYKINFSSSRNKEEHYIFN